jgi:2-oxoglutarate ferredoxin oxidoreductase subunit beta
MNEMTKLTAKDFATDQEVRWCPGCGDYAVLKAVQRTMPELGVRPENVVFVSGIGCSSRFPYYMETYGFHTIHGRAPTFATGIKLANPELDVWIITGDGDALSIGGNHTMHVLRRNLDCQILLFNNEIYGLTKGSIRRPAGSARARPRRRSDRSTADQPERLCARIGRALRGARHRREQISARRAQGRAPAQGRSFVEIFQNCIVYNDDVFAPVHGQGACRQAALAGGGQADAVRRRRARA